ncbi:hypothetical protein PHOBOS_93 [Erwinia phage vB_EamM_Phobos]|uniref:hypothetical protein n=1 Tax=Erwinia phage vB_EamM_Phobos TaxID=1883377 RepID=UPI00081CD69E|nr:hypothetical protein BIZ79_gp093 [Erwinia phage vB_EamM_Phobos]ANZ50283.1 hypothetical protein PHOBOS_93 [Erwinia phage vB_EamM_Phobos]
MFAPALINFERACKVIRQDGYYKNAKDELPKNMQCLEKASELQITSFIAHRHGVNKCVVPWMPELSLTPIKRYQSLLIVDRGDKTFIETINGFKVARMRRIPNGTDEPILNHQNTIIINLSDYRVAYDFIGGFFIGLVTGYYESSKKAMLKRLGRK